MSEENWEVDLQRRDHMRHGGKLSAPYKGWTLYRSQLCFQGYLFGHPVAAGLERCVSHHKCDPSRDEGVS